MLLLIKALNLKPEQEFLTYDGSYVLIQTPYVSGINQENLHKLSGGEMKEKIFKLIHWKMIYRFFSWSET